MPVDEEYGRRPIPLPPQASGATSPAPAAAPCCIVPVDHLRYSPAVVGTTDKPLAEYHLSTAAAVAARYHPPAGSLDRYHGRYSPTDHYHKDSSSKPVDRYAPPYSTTDRKRYHHPPRYDQYTFPAIPCPERFATQERVSYQVPYMEPPSPAPASDRFVPPPPLSPANTPSPDCFPNNAFPSPTGSAPPPERFIPPPPLSPSPTEKYSPRKIDRYHARYKDRQYNYERYHHDRVPPNAHMPVDRYIPPQQDPYYYHAPYERYPKYPSPNDPYMRRDLPYHYRFPLPYPAGPSPSQYQQTRTGQRVGRTRCCPYQESNNQQPYQQKPSPAGSSSGSSTISSSKEIAMECQNVGSAAVYHALPQREERGTQCASPRGGVAKGGACRHSVCSSPGVEYVGASGGRHVCATPPPPRGALPEGQVMCGEGCCAARRGQTTLNATVWRTPPPQQTPPLPQPPSMQASPPQQRTSPPVVTTPVGDAATGGGATTEPEPPSTTTTPKMPPVQRAVSLPVPPEHRTRSTPAATRQLHYSQSERLPNRPPLQRSLSRKEMIKMFIKKETATFFGVDEDNEEKEQRRWLDRRIRMASRTYGPVKDEFRDMELSHRRTISDNTVPVGGGFRMSGQLQAERPDVLPGVSDVPDARQERRPETTLRRKDSVARMTWDGLSYVVNTLTRHRPRRRSQQSQLSRSFPPDTPYSTSSIEEEAFFQKPTSSSPTSPRQEGEDALDRGDYENSAIEPAYRDRSMSRPHSGGWRRDPHVVLRHEGQNRPSVVGGSRIFSSLLDNVLDNSNRRQYGMGWVGKMFGRSMRRSIAEEMHILEQLDDMEDHRPFFTYWVTTVQFFVLLISIICFHFAPFGVDLHSRSGQVLVTSLSLQQVDYLEPANFWYGPRASDLIHLGAKFAPCMRVDDKISQQIEKIRMKERETACCIRNDDSGCVQSSQADCSLRGLRPTKTISKWNKWSAGEAGPGGRLSGSVCGLDPKFCDAPASVHPYEWPDDITKWPICRKTNTQFSTPKRSGSRDKSAEHMVCEVIGHPCCIGIHGQCKITTKEYCDFVRGTFHEEASLCSQVSCLNDVCGMLPFYFPETPDQFYRLWTSIFLHAGILQLAVTIFIQYFLMRDLEKLTGSLRIGIIYIGSGVAGNLASAIFVPYRADVGPAGSQFGLLACLIVEVLNAWPMLKHPNQALCKLLSITLALFLIGLLPWVDNYAHLFGFVFGFLLSYALLPFISFGPYERRKKIVLIWVCLLSAGFLFISLVLLFYIIPVYDCKICSYLNCIPFTRDFCASQNINFKREEPVV